MYIVLISNGETPTSERKWESQFLDHNFNGIQPIVVFLDVSKIHIFNGCN